MFVVVMFPSVIHDCMRVTTALAIATRGIWNCHRRGRKVSSGGSGEEIFVGKRFKKLQTLKSPIVV